MVSGFAILGAITDTGFTASGFGSANLGALILGASAFAVISAVGLVACLVYLCIRRCIHRVRHVRFLILLLVLA